MLNATYAASAAFSPFHINAPYTPSPVILVAISSFILLAGTFYTLSAFNSKSKIPVLGGLSIVNAWNFFVRRSDFLQSNLKRMGQPMFSFKVLQHQVVALSGEDARRVFLNEKSLSFTEGYSLLMGAAPKLSDIGLKSVEEEESNDQVIGFNKKLQHILRRERLQDGKSYMLNVVHACCSNGTPSKVLPTLFSDIIKRMEGWGDEGKINPFNDVYNFVFQMTVRMATCRELSEDRDAVDRLFGLYWKLEKSATPVGLLLPWLPSKAKKDKQQATADLYNMLSGYVDSRRSAGVPGSDAIDLLIAQDEDNPAIVGFVLGVIFAGVINTGIISCWTLLYLGANEDWKQKAVAEIRQLINTHTNTTSSDPIHQRLSTVPISAWEDEMPILESVVRETMRLATNGTLLRRNLIENLAVSDKTLDRGAFMAYNTGDVHLNSNIYSEPEIFEPDRFVAPREEGKSTYAAFLGWGAGRHPCAGMKVAKLEIKMILALMLIRYEYTLVDAAGKPPKQLPKPNRNDIHQSRPIGEPCFLQYKKLMD